MAKTVINDEDLHQIPSVEEGHTEDLSKLDDAVLRAQGHDAAMDRQFSWIAALGMAFSITNSWVGYLVYWSEHDRPGQQLTSRPRAASDRISSIWDHSQ